jgi:CBS domain-containing protein
MITDRDICMACSTRNQAPASISVRDAMSQKLYVCKPDSPVSDAEKIMRSQQVRRIPVVDAHGRLAGVLSLADIARRAERSRGDGARDITPEEVVSILGSISQPQSAARSH